MYTVKLHSTISETADDEQLKLVKFDDQASFEDIYMRYWSKLYIYAFNVLGEKEICEDIVQEIFIDLWTRRHNLSISNLNSYLYRSVKFQIFNHFRRSKYKKQLLLEFDLLVEENKIEDSYDKKEQKARIDDAISKLPEQRRIIFRLSRHDELSNREISEKLNISLQTVKNQISVSLKFLRKSLKKAPLLFF